VAEGLSEASQQVLTKVFRMVEIWRERIQADAQSPAAGSSLRKDDEVTDPYRLSQAVNMALLSAVDHFEALRVVVQEAGVMPARAVFTLLRAALENAAIAVWLLAHPNRDERVLRLLRLQWADVLDEIQALELVGASPPMPRDDRKGELQEIARARGLSQEQVSQVTARLSWTSIVKNAGDGAHELTGDRALLAWTVSSGIAHARTWAALSILDRVEPPIVDGDVVRIKLKASDQWVTVVVNIAALMLAEGWRLFDEQRQVPLG
jgi:hypothetical protein